MISGVEQAQYLYDLGEMLIEDDKQDIFYTTYKHRTGHRYRGKKSKTHESPYHHWQLGLALCLLGQVGGVLAQMKEMHDELNTNNELNSPELK